MSRGVQGGQAMMQVAVFQGQGVRAGDRVHAEHLGLQIQVVQQHVVAFVEIGRALPKFLQFRGGADMVEVGMGVQQGGDLEAQGLNSPLDAFGFAARIHHDPGQRAGIPKQAAVAAQGAYGKGFQVQHGKLQLQLT